MKEMRENIKIALIAAIAILLIIKTFT